MTSTTAASGTHPSCPAALPPSSMLQGLKFVENDVRKHAKSLAKLPFPELHALLRRTASLLSMSMGRLQRDPAAAGSSSSPHAAAQIELRLVAAAGSLLAATASWCNVPGAPRMPADIPGMLLATIKGSSRLDGSLVADLLAAERFGELVTGLWGLVRQHGMPLMQVRWLGLGVLHTVCKYRWWARDEASQLEGGVGVHTEARGLDSTPSDRHAI